MEKYGVVTEKPKPGEKTAARNDQERRGSNVPISDSQGTKPWEPKSPPPLKKPATPNK